MVTHTGPPLPSALQTARGGSKSIKATPEEAAMKVLFIISSDDTAFWLSEVTHPYWHLTERGIEIEFASPAGGKVVYDPYSDPYFKNSTEPEDLVSKGFLSDKDLVVKLEKTLVLKDAGRRRNLATYVREKLPHSAFSPNRPRGGGFCVL
jgi:hypothetical protein